MGAHSDDADAAHSWHARHRSAAADITECAFGPGGMALKRNAKTMGGVGSAARRLHACARTAQLAIDRLSVESS